MEASSSSLSLLLPFPPKRFIIIFVLILPPSRQLDVDQLFPFPYGIPPLSSDCEISPPFQSESRIVKWCFCAGNGLRELGEDDEMFVMNC